MIDSRPLSGLRIAVTRPQAQADVLAQGIENSGGTCIRFPLLEISQHADLNQLKSEISTLDQINLAIFISPNAVRFGIDAINRFGEFPSGIRLAAVGNGTANALLEAGFSHVLVPAGRADSEALLALPELQQVQGWKIAIFRGDHGRELLGDTLKLRGADVAYINCYRRGKPQQGISPLLAARPDILTISSSESLQNLWEMLPESEKKHFLALPLFVLHERIAVAARALGWQNVTVTSDGDEGMLKAISAWANGGNKE